MLSTIFSSVEKNCLKFQRILFGRRPFWTWSKLSEALAVNPSFSQVLQKSFQTLFLGKINSYLMGPINWMLYLIIPKVSRKAILERIYYNLLWQNFTLKCWQLIFWPFSSNDTQVPLPRMEEGLSLSLSSLKHYTLESRTSNFSIV